MNANEHEWGGLRPHEHPMADHQTLWSRCATRLGARQPQLVRRAGGAPAFGDFAAGLIEFGLHFIGKLKLIFEKIINPRADLFHHSARQGWQSRLNFLN